MIPNECCFGDNLYILYVAWRAKLEARECCSELASFPGSPVGKQKGKEEKESLVSAV